MSEYIVYKKTNCKACNGTGAIKNYLQAVVPCYLCHGLGDGGLEPVSLEKALIDIIKEQPTIFPVDYPTLK